MDIGLFTSVYFNNIGNGFIDLGAECALKEAIPGSANIIKVSQCANFAASLGRLFMVRENKFIAWIWKNVMAKFAAKLHDRTYTNAVSTLDVFSVCKIMKFDYLIIPGCVLTVPFFTIYGKLLEEKSKQGCKIIFLGASGNYYTDYEIEQVTKFLKDLKPYAIMTRDSVAFNHYKDLARFSYNGIDNVFFVNKLNIPKLESTMDPYVVVNIELDQHKDILRKLRKELEGRNVIYTNHKPFPYSKVSKLAKKNIMISDYPMDYLVLYKNAKEVFSDRVHACIPTLSFGNKATLFSESPRKALFQNVGIEEIKNEPMDMDVQGLTELQNRQIDFLKHLFL